jgi:hypothetical protein
VTSFIDINSGDLSGQPSRWDRHDGQSAILALDAALVAAGLPNQLDAAHRLLARAELLAADARAQRQAARNRLDVLSRALVVEDPPPDIARYGVELLQLGVWLDENSAAMLGVMQASMQVRANATQTCFALAPGLYAKLAELCRGIVAEVAEVPAFPADIWAAPTTATASELAMRSGRETDWAMLVRLGAKWDAVHACAELLRETGVFQSEMNYSAPVGVASAFLNIEAAVDGLPTVRRLPGALRLRAAIDRDWRPGLYLQSDHERAAEEKTAKRGLLAKLGGR